MVLSGDDAAGSLPQVRRKSSVNRKLLVHSHLCIIKHVFYRKCVDKLAVFGRLA